MLIRIVFDLRVECCIMVIATALTCKSWHDHAHVPAFVSFVRNGDEMLCLAPSALDVIWWSFETSIDLATAVVRFFVVEGVIATIYCC